MTDLVLAIAHHLLVFSLVGAFVAELVLLRPGIEAGRLRQLRGLDAAYGGLAGLVVVVGIVRVIFGAAGWEYYVGNWVFWAKMAAFVLVGIASIPPTRAIGGWVRAGITPDAAAVNGVRRYLFLQAGLLALIPAFAAAMARGYGA